jgi:bla regulator protein BlaR1
VKWCAAAVILAMRSAAQSGPAFEVASVKPGQTSDRPSIRALPGGRFIATNETVKYLIQFAYNVQDYQISGGPKWMDSAGFDIVAAPENLTPTADNIGVFRQKLQRLLADRFQLTLQHTTKELPVYTLVVGKGGPKLQEGEKPKNPTDMRLSGGKGLMVAQKVQLGLVAQVLSGRLGRPVTDDTGLTGYYNFRLEWTQDETEPALAGENGAAAAVPVDRAGPSIFTALQEQLGLRLEGRKGPVEVLAIERVEMPSAN